jgi:lysophospholipase L1-like esterase
MMPKASLARGARYLFCTTLLLGCGGADKPGRALDAGAGGAAGSGVAGAAGSGLGGAAAGAQAAAGSGAAGNGAAGNGASGSASGGSAGSSSQGTAGTSGSGGGEPVIAAGVRWVGRVDVSDPQAIKLAWSGTGFVGTFSGAVVSAKLKTVGDGDIFFQPVVDGKPGARFSVGSAEKTVELASGLSAGEHRVELYRETEGKGFGYSVFSGFAAGTPAAPPAASGRLIEVIGDSISAGYGNLGSEQHAGGGPDPSGGCRFTTETESAYLAYGHVAARAVDAEASVLAGSGWGIYSDNGGNTANVMPALFANVLGEQSTPVWPFTKQPQAVVINLGTNDAAAKNLTADKFKPAYSAFIATIRGKYPNTLILCAVGSMISGTDRDNAKTYLTEVIADLAAKGDQKLKLLDLGTQDANMGTGCDWHPSKAEQARLGMLLATELKASLGW